MTDLDIIGCRILVVAPYSWWRRLARRWGWIRLAEWRRPMQQRTIVGRDAAAHILTMDRPFDPDPRGMFGTWKVKPFSPPLPPSPDTTCGVCGGPIHIVSVGIRQTGRCSDCGADTDLGPTPVAPE